MIIIIQVQVQQAQLQAQWTIPICHRAQARETVGPWGNQAALVPFINKRGSIRIQHHTRHRYMYLYLHLYLYLYLYMYLNFYGYYDDN